MYFAGAGGPAVKVAKICGEQATTSIAQRDILFRLLTANPEIGDNVAQYLEVEATRRT